MNVQEFISRIQEDIELHSIMFSKNMERKELTYCEWIETFIAWMEWEKKDCHKFYEGEQ